MQWLNELPFADNRVLQIGFLLACGIAALIVLAIFYRLTFAHRLRVPGGRTRQPRLGLVDAFSLDGQRQLVLVRRDNVEHLVMIGGPNDVLVESQINRAVAPTRESIQTSPLLAPSAPVRQVPLAAQAEVPAPVAAKAPISPPPPAAAPVVAKAPPPAQPPAPTQAPSPKPMAPEQARQVPPPPPAQPAEPVRPAAASSPTPRQAEPRQVEPRPTQPRPTMPPPIVPANAPANRATAARPTEATSLRGPGNPPTPAPVAAPARRPDRPEPAVVVAKAEPAVAPAKTEPPAGPTVTVPAATTAFVEARPAPKTSPSPGLNGAQKPADARAPAEKMNLASSAKPSPKVEDPFADLDSLEAEMARLLGREKPD
jgi:flagellar protein FliO/FliZ